MIASSPTDIQPVLDTIAESAARVCGADDAAIRLLEGDVLRLVAHHGSIPPQAGLPQRPIDRWSVSGRAVVDRQNIHINDLRSLPETEFPGIHDQMERLAARMLSSRPAIVVRLIFRATSQSRPIGTPSRGVSFNETPFLFLIPVH